MITLRELYNKTVSCYHIVGFASLHNITNQPAFCQPEKNKWFRSAKNSSNSIAASWMPADIDSLLFISELQWKLEHCLQVSQPEIAASNTKDEQWERKTHVRNTGSVYCIHVQIEYRTPCRKLEVEEFSYAMLCGRDKQLLMWKRWQEWGKDVCGMREAGVVCLLGHGTSCTEWLASSLFVSEIFTSSTLLGSSDD